MEAQLPAQVSPQTATEKTYRILDNFLADPSRSYTCSLDDEQLNQLDKDGYIALPSIYGPAEIAAFTNALELLRQEIDAGSKQEYNPGDEFYRDLMVHSPLFETFMEHELFIGVARAMLGPLVRLRGMTCRDNRSETGGNGGFGWHIHQRSVCTPQPRWFSPPQGLDCLLYLDGLSEENGRLAVVPGSHNNPQQFIPHSQNDRPDQNIINLPPGSLVLLHTNCYHRSIPALNSSARRRLIIVSWTPAWYRQSPHDKSDRSEWIAKKSKEWADDPAKMELLGVGGYT